MLIKEDLDLNFVTNYQVSSLMYVQEIMQTGPKVANFQLIARFFQAFSNAESSVPSQH